jgi:hypothetical protein
MIITLLDNPGPTLTGFKYFWMRKVTGFNPKHHCAACLEGSYVLDTKRAPEPDKPLSLFTPSSAVYYLCGVSAPYVHAKNFHLALEVAHGFTVERQLYTGARLVVEGAREIPFNDAAARNRFPNLGRDFLTCRNFQFGAHYFKPQPSLF